MTRYLVSWTDSDGDEGVLGVYETREQADTEIAYDREGGEERRYETEEIEAQTVVAEAPVSWDFSEDE